MTKPLHIFEPRYIQLVERAVEAQMPVALAFVEDPLRVGPVKPGELLPYVKSVAGYGKVQVIERRPYENLLIFIYGEGKVQLGPVLDTQTPYLVCSAEIIPEKSEMDESLMGSVKALESIIHRWIRKHVADPNQQNIFIQNITGPKEIVGAFASYLVEDHDLQQIVLEMSDINEQVQFLIRLVGSNRILR
jgi:Lon protease-like protein